MATLNQKKEVLTQTKLINALKSRRNKYKVGTKARNSIQVVIDLTEKDLKAKRAKYKL
jgi:hypothetical protein